MKYMPVDVVATFNVEGRIKPNYIRLEDEFHTLHTYRIENILYSREEKYGGIPVILFCCNILREECMQIIHIKYHINTHQWVFAGGYDDYGRSGYNSSIT